MSGDLLATPSTPPMSQADRAEFATELRLKLNSRRDVFVIDRHMFEPQESDSGEHATEMQRRLVGHPYPDKNGAEPDRNVTKQVSAATLRLLLDYCESAWDMDFVSYCAGIFHGRTPREDETAFDLLPDVQSRISADRLGLGHIYGQGS
jgi:hypothetical protein